MVAFPWARCAATANWRHRSDGRDASAVPGGPAGARASFAGCMALPRSPLASPLFADLKGLPPPLVLVGTAELLFSDAERLAAAATAAGVDATLQVGKGLPHVYPLMLGTPEAAAATDRQVPQYPRTLTLPLLDHLPEACGGQPSAEGSRGALLRSRTPVTGH
ncbi:alpha/beta hydrolase fold domain-containing protein [Amycolatopsis sp.]|uniref:alpha/beta hydrolase fold domain-containing protein n=1 Tax=Amycolatopsis sp. TaxID=37632 RepID=UPI0039C8887F